MGSLERIFLNCNFVRKLGHFIGQSHWFLERKFDVVLHTAELVTAFFSVLPLRSLVYHSHH